MTFCRSLAMPILYTFAKILVPGGCETLHLRKKLGIDIRKNRNAAKREIQILFADSERDNIIAAWSKGKLAIVAAVEEEGKEEHDDTRNPISTELMPQKG